MVVTSTAPTSFYSGDSVFMYEYLLPEHIWGKFQDDYKGARQETGFPSVGTGPFIITNYVKNQYVQLDRNPNYWDSMQASRRTSTRSSTGSMAIKTQRLPRSSRARSTTAISLPPTS